jgi:hypothetical protein
MNIRLGVTLVGIATLFFGGPATHLYADPYNPAPQRHAQIYHTQPRVIIVQPNRQSYGQSITYGQQGQVRQYDYYPGLQHQQPRHSQHWTQPYRYPAYGQQPRYHRHDNYGQPRDRWSQRPGQQNNNQYQRPDYRAQQQQYKEQRDYERAMRNRNLDLMLRNAKPPPYQQAPQRNQQRNYGSAIRQ